MSRSINSSVPVKKIELESLQYGAISVIPDSFMSERMEAEFYRDLGSRLAVQIRNRVLARNFENHTKTVNVELTFDQPATWWDALKQEKFPKWFNNRRPVQFKTTTKKARRTVTFKKYATYPDAPPMPRTEWMIPVGYDSFIGEESDE